MNLSKPNIQYRRVFESPPSAEDAARIIGQAARQFFRVCRNRPYKMCDAGLFHDGRVLWVRFVGHRSVASSLRRDDPSWSALEPQVSYDDPPAPPPAPSAPQPETWPRNIMQVQKIARDRGIDIEDIMASDADGKVDLIIARIEAADEPQEGTDS